jgi:malonyl-CoA O-methyltransferase
MNPKNHPIHLKNAYNRAAQTYDKAAVLSGEVAIRLMERLDWVRLQPAVVLDIGCGTGIATSLLMKRYPKAAVIGVDSAENMLRAAKRKEGFLKRMRWVAADAFCLPFSEGSIDLIVSNFMFYCIREDELPRFFKELYRVLRPGGLLQFSTLGPYTLAELRDSWDQNDKTRVVHSYTDMHDIGDQLMLSHFSNPVLDGELFTLTYFDVKKLFFDFKMLGESQMVKTGFTESRGLIGKNRWKQFINRLESYRNAEGLLPMTFEVIYGHAWKSENANAASSFHKDESGSVHIPLSAIRKK